MLYEVITAVGVISGLLEGLSLAEAVARGNLIGALAIQVRGDSEGLPTREGLQLRNNFV